MTQALYRKWRPSLWEEVVGQDHIVQTLKNALATNRVGHAYLFSGPRGTGKTTTARLLAKAVNCTGETPEKPCDVCSNCVSVKNGSFLDLIEIDAATNTGVDDVRDLKEKINFAPNVGKYKVYIIDEVHMFTNNAFNALLKTLEEPPAHAIFILATTDIHKVPATILSRCQRYEFRRIPVQTVVDLLKKNALADGIKVNENVLALIARQSTGSMRDAISLLDQLSSSNHEITMDEAVSLLGTASHTAIADIVDAIIQRDMGKGIDHLQSALDGGTESRQLARQMVDYLHNLLLAKNDRIHLVDAAHETREAITRQAKQLETRHVLAALERFRPLAGDTRITTWQPGLGFELALVETIADLAGMSPEKAVGSTPPAVNPAGVVQAKSANAPLHVPPANVAQVKEPSSRSTLSPEPEVIPQNTSSHQASVKPVVETDSNLTEIVSNWKKIAEAVRRYSPSTQGLLNTCRPVSIKNDTLFLAFASSHLKELMESNAHIENTQRAVKAVIGQETQIRCVVLETASSPGSKPVSAEGDGMVSTALREMGGRVVEVREIPEDKEKE